MASSRDWLIDHTGIGVSDVARSGRFYEAALQPLGFRVVMCIDANMEPVGRDCPNLAGMAFGANYPSFWIDAFHPSGAKQHTAFRATSRQGVDSFYREGLAAGGIDNGGPGLRSGGYPPGYYAAFLLDPDGNNIEAVYRENPRPAHDQRSDECG